MKKDCCENCVHFLKHYVILGNRLFVVNCGHCIYPRVKSRKPRTPACAHFTRILLLEDGKPYRHRRLEIVE